MLQIKLEKTPGEDFPITVDFDRWDLLDSYALSSATVTANTGDGQLTIGAATVSGTRVTFRVTGGTVDTSYRLTVKGITVSPAYDVEQVLDLYVRNPPTG